MVAIVGGCDDVSGLVDVEFVVARAVVAGADAAVVHIASSPSLGVLWWWFASGRDLFG